MGFWTRRREEQRTLSAVSLQPLFAPDLPVGPHNALTVGDVYAAVRVLADAAASCPLLVYRRKGEGRSRISNRTSELLRRPGPATTQANLVATIVGHLQLWGNCYVGKYKDGDGRVERLLPIRPDRVTPELRRGEPVYTVVNDAGWSREHGLDDLIHIKGLSTDGLVGLSPVRQARRALELSSALQRHAAAFVANDARPSGILKIPGNASIEQMGRLKEMWTHRYGDQNVGGIAVMTGEVDFVSIGMPPDDAQFLEQRELSATEVARIFRVPPWMIGAKDGGSMTYSNVEQQQLAFAMHSLRPWLVVIEQALTNDRDLFVGEMYCEFLLDGLLRADHKTRAEVYRMALDPMTGWMRREEVRRLENLDPETAAELRALVADPTTNGAGAIA